MLVWMAHYFYWKDESKTVLRIGEVAIDGRDRSHTEKTILRIESLPEFQRWIPLHPMETYPFPPSKEQIQQFSIDQRGG